LAIASGLTAENEVRNVGAKKFIGTAGALAALSILLSAAAAPPRQSAPAVAVKEAAPAVNSLSLELDPAQSKVHWTLPSSLHTVHGTFAVVRGMMSMDRESGKAGGEIVVNARSGASGNDSRDAKMHKEILETAKYPDVVFHPTQVEGKVTPTGPCDVKIRGTLSVHGADHEITALVHAQIVADSWNGSAKFDVPYVQWGIKNPSNFLLKADKVVHVEVEMAGRLQPAK
jgi:polyisoprenoid-binding protein YceI